MDTITALATGTGGAISVIRLSGPQAIPIADGIFRPAAGVPLRQKEGYTINYGSIVDPATGEMVDQVLASLFRAPRSYTGEDMVEISAHASPYVCKRILELLIAGGARPAEAGEFTVRAFLAGKMDLAQAEAVADMIASTDRATHVLAANQMRGGYSQEFRSLREELLRLASLLELELDFSEEDVEFADRSQLRELVSHILSRIESLEESFTLGNALKEGVPVAIAGEPNVGKSTLLNALLKEDRAMVSDIAGTTRDVIEESLVIDGIRFRFLDTAGIRHTEDPLEKMGIERTYGSIRKATIILWMVDAQQYADQLVHGAGSIHPPFEIQPGQRLAILANKIDRLSKKQCDTLESLSKNMAGSKDHPAPILIAAKNGINIEAVSRFLSICMELEPLYEGSAIVSHARHRGALTRSAEALRSAMQSLHDGLSGDLLAEDIRQALYHLGTVTGEITSDEILGAIFSKFCIGK